MFGLRWYALHHAALIGDLRKAERLVDAGANLDRRNGSGETPLFATMAMVTMASLHVSSAGRDAVFRLLVERGADVNAVCAQGSVLHAVCRGMPMNRDTLARNERVHWLLERGARPVHRDGLGHTVLSLLLPYYDEPTRDLVRVLIARGAELDASDHHGETVLHHAIERHLDSASFLLELGAATDRADRRGRTALHALCDSEPEPRRGPEFPQAPVWGGADRDPRQVLALCDRLLAHHAPIDRADVEGRTPLACAAERGSLDLVRALLAAGASPDGTDRRPPLLLAHDRGRDEIVRVLLGSGANRGARFDNGDTLLHRAAHDGPLELVQLLISAGAPLEATNANGATPLIHAIRDAEIVAALLAAGADVNAADGIDYTALLGAYRRDVIELLLAHGADPNCASDSGWTALRGARNRGDTAVVELLLRHGARDELHPRVVLRIYRRRLDKVLATASRVVALGNLANHDGYHFVALAQESVLHLFELRREKLRGHRSFPLAEARIARLEATATTLGVSIEHGRRRWELEITRFSMPTKDGEPQTAAEAAVIGEMTARIEAALVAARDGRLGA